MYLITKGLMHVIKGSQLPVDDRVCTQIKI
jgi:hypothetical protein